jgi:hypothetical protein
MCDFYSEKIWVLWKNKICLPLPVMELRSSSLDCEVRSELFGDTFALHQTFQLCQSVIVAVSHGLSYVPFRTHVGHITVGGQVGMYTLLDV